MQSNAELSRRIAKALSVVGLYARLDSAQNKQWVLDQVVRALAGTPSAYKEWIADYPNWNTGVAP